MKTLTSREKEILDYSFALHERYRNCKTDSEHTAVLREWTEFLGKKPAHHQVKLPSGRLVRN